MKPCHAWEWITASPGHASLTDAVIGQDLVAGYRKSLWMIFFLAKASFQLDVLGLVWYYGAKYPCHYPHTSSQRLSFYPKNRYLNKVGSNTSSTDSPASKKNYGSFYFLPVLCRRMWGMGFTDASCFSRMRFAYLSSILCHPISCQPPTSWWAWWEKNVQLANEVEVL